MKMKEIQIPQGKKAYFASDFHLGFPGHHESRERELHLLSWLDLVEQDGSVLFLLGDLFDFWFEFKEVIPKGYVRFLGRLANLSDRGIDIHIFVGNHDLWMFHYLEKEIGAKIYREPTLFQFHTIEKSFRVYMGHGDGLGPGDVGYKILKQVFVHPVAQFLFKILHPDLGVRLAHAWSNTRKSSTIKSGEVPFDPATDFILAYVRERFQLDAQQSLACDAYVFGHRHHPIEFSLDGHSTYFNLGDWFSPHFKNAYYLTIDEKRIEFLHFPRA